MSNVLRLPAEQLYANELEALKEEDKKEEKPIGWQLSPKAVLKFLTGGTACGVNITPKYIGHNRLVEIAIATLLTDRSLLVLLSRGFPKTLRQPSAATRAR